MSNFTQSILPIEIGYWFESLSHSKEKGKKLIISKKKMRWKRRRKKKTLEKHVDLCKINKCKKKVKKKRKRFTSIAKVTAKLLKLAYFFFFLK